jgi:hypothetical protein
MKAKTAHYGLDKFLTRERQLQLSLLVWAGIMYYISQHIQ